MDDEDYARELFEILTRPLDPDEPVDGYGTGKDRIDRAGGFGTEVRVTSVDVVPGSYGAQLEVRFALEVPPEVDLPDHGSVLLPFAAEWREAQGFAYPALHAPWVARDVEEGVRRLVGAHSRTPEPERALPDREAQRAMLLEILGGWGVVVETPPGHFLVRHPHGRELTVVVTADQWEEVVAQHGRRDWLREHVDETIASGFGDEPFLVFWDGELVRSVREELPPVSGALRSISLMQAARDRGEEPYPNAYWSVAPPR